MSAAELKEKLISRIISENDDALLQEWLNMMQPEKEYLYELPAELTDDLDEIEAEMDSGEYLSNKEVFTRAKEAIENAVKK